ncbi:MAG: hypothetical protein ACYC35_14805 [Pirellulales bacterium]
MESETFAVVDRAAAVEAVQRMSEEELRFLNRLIVDRLKLLGQARSMVMLARFSVGDRVSFQTTSGERKLGFVIRLNKKTASISTDDGQHWNVHPGLLSSLAPATSSRGKSGMCEKEPDYG